MAENAIGAVLEIPEDVLRRITDADKRIEQLATRSIETQRIVSSQFKLMGDAVQNDFTTQIETAMTMLGGIDAKSIKNIAQILHELSNKKDGNGAKKDVEEIGKAAETANASVTQTSQSINSLRSNTQNSARSIHEILNDIYTPRQLNLLSEADRDKWIKYLEDFRKRMNVLSVDQDGGASASLRDRVQGAVNTLKGLNKEVLKTSQQYREELSKQEEKSRQDKDRHDEQVLSRMGKFYSEKEKAEMNANTKAYNQKRVLEESQLNIEIQNAKQKMAQDKEFLDAMEAYRQKKRESNTNQIISAYRHEQNLRNTALEEEVRNAHTQTRLVADIAKKRQQEQERITSNANATTTKLIELENLYNKIQRKQGDVANLNGGTGTSLGNSEARQIKARIEELRNITSAELKKENFGANFLNTEGMQRDVAQAKKILDSLEDYKKQLYAENKAGKIQEQNEEKERMRLIANKATMEKTINDLEYKKKRLGEVDSKSSGLGIDSKIVKDEIDKIDKELNRLRDKRLNNDSLMRNAKYASRVFGTVDQSEIQRGYTEVMRIQQKAIREKEANDKRDRTRDENSTNRKLENINRIEKEINNLERLYNRAIEARNKMESRSVNNLPIDPQQLASLNTTIDAFSDKMEKLRKQISTDFPKDKGFIRKTIGSSAYDKFKTENEAIVRESEATLKRLEANDKQRTKNEERESDLRAKKRMDAEKRHALAEFKWYSRNPESAMIYATQAKSMYEMQNAIKYLTEARSRLNTEDGKAAGVIAELNSKIRELKGNIKTVTLGTENVKSKFSGLINTSQQLARQLALMFSVSQIEGYISSIAKVTSEMELQQVALRAILQNRQAADEIFNKTKQLAVQSPFRVGQLVTYSKQLAAYRIESDKLFDTTKRLADVSAGLGIDMQRLILAYGQVKAAAHLRGTEVRQFTEAGINLYGELQAYFKEVKGEAYTTAQIVDMISKRKVAFEDIENVFKRLTDEGGIFYNMQQVQAETLYGKIEKLKDQLYLMQDAIGRSNHGLISGSIDMVSSLMKNWETMLGVVKALIPVLAALTVQHKLHVLAVGKYGMAFRNAVTGIMSLNTACRLFRFQGGILTQSLAALKMGIGMVKNAFIGLGKAIYTSLPLALIFATVEAIMELWHVHKEYTEAMKESNAQISSGYVSINKSINQAKSDVKKALKILVDSMNNAGFSIEIPIDIPEEEAKDKLGEYEEMYKKHLVAMADINSRYNQNLKKGWVVGDDDIETDLTEYAQSYGEFIGKISQMSGVFQEISEKEKDLSKETREMFRVWARGPEKGQDPLEFYEGIAGYIKELEKGELKHGFMEQFLGDGKAMIWRKFGFDNFMNSFDDMKDDMEDALEELDEVFKRKGATPQEMKVIINKKATEKQWNDIAKRLAYKKFNIPWELDKDDVTQSISWVDNYLENYFKDKKYNIKVSYGELSDKPFDTFMTRGDEASKRAKHYKDLVERLEKVKDEEMLMDEEIGEAFNMNEKVVKDMITKKERVQTSAVIAAVKEKARMALDESLALGIDPFKKANEKQEKDIWEARINILKEMHQQYEKVRKYLSEEDAKKNVKENFDPAVKETGLSADIANNYIPSKEGLIDALKKLYKEAANYKKRNEIQKQISELKMEIDNENLKRSLDKSKKIVDDALNGLQLRLKFQEMGLSGRDTDKLFSNLKISLPRTMEEVQQSLYKAFKITPEMAKMNDSELGKIIGEEKLKAFRDKEEAYNKQIVDDQKSNIESLVKDYKTKINSQLEIDLWYARERDKINKYILDEAIRTEMLANLEKEKENKKDTQTWNDFKESGMYLRVFENLESVGSRSLSIIRQKIEGMNNSLENLDPKQLKEINSQLSKLDEEKAKHDPFGTLIEGAKKYFEFISNRPALENEGLKLEVREQEEQKIVELKREELAAATAEYEALKQKEGVQQFELAAAERMVGIANNNLNIANKNLATTQKDKKANQDALREGERSTAKFKAGIKESKELVDRAGKSAKDFAGIWSDDVADSIGLVIDTFDEVYDGIDTMVSGMGDLVESFTKDSESMVEGTSDAVKGTSDAAAESISTMEKATIILTIISAALRVATAIINLFNNDKKKDKEISNIQRDIDALERSYQKLKKAMDDAYSLDNMTKYHRESINNLEEQKKKVKEQKALEEDKKKADQDKIAQYNAKLDEINDQIKENEEAMKEALGGFGSEANYKSAAQAFSDAWVDAFNEGSSTLDALNDKFDEVFYNMLKKQAMMKLAERYLKPLLTQMDKALDAESDGAESLTRTEVDKIKDSGNKAMKAFNDAMKNLFTGVWGLGSKGEGLSALQQGIQGITEREAEALESLLNSMRQMMFRQNDEVIAIRQLLERQYGGSAMEQDNPMIVELKAQTAYLSRISGHFDNITAIGNGGEGIRVIGIS